MSASAEKRASEGASPSRASSAFADAPFMLAIFWVNWIVFAGEILFAAMRISSEGRSFVGGLTSALIDMPSTIELLFGANYANATLYDGRIDTLLASCFLHASLMHIGFNLVALRSIGPGLERIVGSGRVSLLYVGSGIVGSMFSTLAGWIEQQERTGLGASGAICGLIGAALVVGYRTAGPRSPLMRATATWLLTILFLGFAVRYTGLANFDNAAHVGGALGGAAIASLWNRGPEVPERKTIALGLSVGLVIATCVGVVVRDARDPFAAKTITGRLQLADDALRKGDCPAAWNAVLAARRVARRDPQTLHAIYLVRSACGIPES